MNSHLTGIENHLEFFGGSSWQQTVEDCMHGQMNAWNFPVKWEQIVHITPPMRFETLFDGARFGTKEHGNVFMEFRELHHPQTTYGVRRTITLENGREVVIVYATDNEPHDPLVPDEPLSWLVRGDDVVIGDAQYDQAQYNGKRDGLSRKRWGHSYDVTNAALIC